MSFQKEKQISVDPISITEKSVDSIIIQPSASAPKPSEALALNSPPPLLPAKPKFLSCSLPNSANSSPRFGSAALLLKKKWRNHFESQASPRQVEDLTGNGHLQQQQQHELVHFRRSKSCGEGRAIAPSDVDFDLWEHNDKRNSSSHHPYNMINSSRFLDLSFSKTDHQTKKVVKNNHNNNNISDSDDGFKCGALCLFLPGFGKAKPVRARKEEAVVVENGISRTVSLEKFECGSWAASAINEDGDSMSLYFDLPLELIRTGVNDAHSPVSSAFVFDKDRKGVLKNSSTRPSVSAPPRKSHESARHVRFSVSSSPTSYPASPATCITPRLRKAREDFNAFLEAQSA